MDNVKNVLQQYGQEHLLAHFDSLSDTEKAHLLEQIAQIDFEQITDLYQRAVTNRLGGADKQDLHLEPLQAKNWEEYSADERTTFHDTGWQLIQEGKVAALVVAGGQGSRLGHDGPKGTFHLDLPSHKSLFQLQAERLLNLSRRGGQTIPWYIMTSPANHEQTVSFFQEHGYFGFPEQDLFFFQQDVLPAVGLDGKILMQSPSEVSLAPNGNGGFAAALKRSGALDDMQKRGVEWLYYYNVDNALTKVADPDFVGYAATAGHPVASKVIEKKHPEEKAGVFCLANGRPAVIEYTDFPVEEAVKRDASGRLLYNSANVSIHCFRVDFLSEAAGFPLPYQAARKKIKSMGEPVDAFKFELFYFDLFPFASGMSVVIGEREEDFAPLKNAAGADSPAEAREMMLALYQRWLRDAGIDPALYEERTVEISPLTSYAGEGLSEELLLQEGDPIVI